MIRSFGLGPKFEDFTLGTGAKLPAGVDATPLADATCTTCRGAVELLALRGEGGKEDAERPPRGESPCFAAAAAPRPAPKPKPTSGGLGLGEAAP